ncbi:hypothetical protein HHL19_21745 [Streptomyces sp. R302]|uniref:hypothetical protein n=1 Tax=unclassified Streptomyces TaxID=2593676 RepID=UPI00145C5643|nr:MULTISPECIES: hypothetical protein [unclassified Streptomyces]NML51598.1 hypothetical protein [Streptomyces sp. R301]NML81218.1 hypothetical protein [Streptomyces sp. R302]
MLHSLGTSYDTLADVLYAGPDHHAAYRPVLFLLSVERRFALGHDLPANHRLLIDKAVQEAEEQRRDDHDDDTLVRLRASCEPNTTMQNAEPFSRRPETRPSRDGTLR